MGTDRACDRSHDTVENHSVKRIEKVEYRRIIRDREITDILGHDRPFGTCLALLTIVPRKIVPRQGREARRKFDADDTAERIRRCEQQRSPHATAEIDEDGIATFERAG